MNVPRPLVLFLAFCGGAAIFGVPLVLAAIPQRLTGEISVDQFAQILASLAP